jgi:Asp-tRNA(Asn)/Glu-tRNA(Gln) amidotransferase A subunit family amidase
MGDRVDVVDLLPVFDDAHAIHRRIMSAEIAQSFAKEYQDGADQLSDQLRALIEEGQNVSVADYEAALEQVAEFSSDLEGIFGDYDAIMTPPAPGEAPLGLESTGDASFNTIWTLCGTPAITLPMLQGADDMPLGVQLVSYKGDDARLFRTARWLLELFAD